MIVGFCGGIGSGKSTVSKRVSELTGWPRASCGGYVRDVALSRGIDQDREALQALGEQLIRDPLAFSKAILSTIDWQQGRPLVIDGIRHAEALAAFRALIAPTTLSLVFLRASQTLRGDRTGLGDDIAKVDAHSTELQVDDLESDADLVLDAERDPDHLAKEVVEWMGRNAKQG